MGFTPSIFSVMASVTARCLILQWTPWRRSAPSKPDLLAASDSGASNTDNITNVSKPTFSGSGETARSVTLLDGSTTIGTGTVTSGTWSITAAAALTEGPNAITATQTDLAGNTSAASAPLKVTLESAPCFCAGTSILTPAGERMVETLMQGDIVLTIVCDELSPQPVKWLGRRRIDLTAYPRPETVAPIRIRRGAFADNMPHTDLLVSPDHAVFVDGKLICVRQLINGATIRQEKGWTSVEYFHVELDAHSILLAEGLPAESYLNTSNRGFFANSGEPLLLHPDLTDETDYPTREAGSCAPRCVWSLLAGAPTDTRPWLDDRRCLGVYVERIVLRGASEVREVPATIPACRRVGGQWNVMAPRCAGGRTAMPCCRCPRWMARRCWRSAPALRGCPT